MTENEKLDLLLEKISNIESDVSSIKLTIDLAYVQGVAADEEADNIFCQRMVENYENDPDPDKGKGIPLEDCLKEWGID